MQEEGEAVEAAENQPESEVASSDTKADVWAIIIMFTAAVLMAVHFISGFTFDF